MALVAPDGRWLKVNTSLCRIVGFCQEELLVRDFQSITHPDDLHADLVSVQQMLSGEIATYELEKRYIHKNGSIVWISLTASLVKDSDGMPLYFVSQIQDITARKVAEDALMRLAVRDELTGLFNRREMNRLLHEETLRSQRHQRPLSLLMVDIDWFKRVNDTFGHQAGDRALQQVARAILDCVRTLDRAARYGGEELAIILPETSGTEALVVAERIRTRVAESAFSVGGNPQEGPHVQLTVSVGIGTMVNPLDGSTDRLIGDADRALYTAKSRGRNCSVLSADLEPVALSVAIPAA
jgi:diguanylate cyclase (GGDEF)-like protein/PAS domain S-box-containing protein